MALDDPSGRALSCARRASAVGAETAGNEKPFANEIGSQFCKERPAGRWAAVLAHYVADLERMTREAERVLVPGGRAVYVIGDNTVRGKFIPNSKFLQAVAVRAGLRVSSMRRCALPADRRYLPPPMLGTPPGSLDQRMRWEVILTFVKPGRRRASRPSG